MAQRFGLRVHYLVNDFTRQEDRKHGEKAKRLGELFDVFKDAHGGNDLAPIWAQ